MKTPSAPLYRHALCLFPYHRHLSGINFFPPTGLEYVAGALENAVGRLSLVDMGKDDEIRTAEDLRRFIAEEDVDLVCASLNWDYNADKAVSMLKSIPEEIPLVIGGQTATKRVEALLGDFPNLKAVVRGEGEETIVEFAEGKPLSSIRGLSYREDGKFVHNENRPLPPAGDLPPPDRGLRRCRYRVDTLGLPLLRGNFDAVLSSRGCPFNCKFCTFSLNPLGQKRRYSSRPVESVIEELEGVEAEYVIFSDDYFFAEPKRTERLCREIVRRGLQRNYIVNARLDAARRPSMLEAAREAGVKILLLGVESPTDRILKQLNKGITREQIRRYMPVIRSIGFFNHGYFIYGNLGETEAEMMEIPRFARELGLDSITLSKLRAEEFSPIHEDVANTPGAWLGSTGFVYQEGLDRKELKRIGKAMQRDFYSPDQLARIARKAIEMDLLKIFDIPRLTALLPFLLWAFAKRRLAHRRAKKA